MPRANSRRFIINDISLGVTLLFLAVVIAFVFPYASLIIRFTIYVLFGFGIALLLIKSDKHASLSIKWEVVTLTLIGRAVIPMFFIIFDPIAKFQINNQEKLVKVTVFVHGKKGKLDMVLRQQGSVIMDVNGIRQQQYIGRNGDAHFGNLQIGDKVRLDIDYSEPYHPINRDSVYTIDESTKIYVEVGLDGIDKIKGMVLYEEIPLSGVVVSTSDLSDTTDVHGTFTINVPENKQHQQYKIIFYKDGFKNKSVNAFPQTGQPLEIVMEKK